MMSEHVGKHQQSETKNQQPNQAITPDPGLENAPEYAAIAARASHRFSGPVDPDTVLGLQSLVGNQATQHLLAQRHADAMIQRSTARVQHTSAPPSIQRGEAGVHQNIEMTAWGTEAPALGSNQSHSQDQHSAMEVYVGNWMRDFSQVFVPTVMNTVSEIPQRPGDPDSAPIGAEGGEALVTGLLRALASLEFGPEITNTLVTGGPGGNIGVYRPEEHMDNPAGMSEGGDTLVRNPTGELVPGDQADPLAAEDQLAGSAVEGGQLENAQLYQISGEGLQSHIYNTIESVKQQFVSAFHAKATPQGRMHFGTGLHGVEDYFAHSNFIEVAMNITLQQNRDLLPVSFPASSQPGGHLVDTMFDATAENPDGSQRQAITTGTFGPKDTQISIAHAILPKLPNLFSAVDGAIDRALLALEQDGSSWAMIKETLKGDPAGLALTYVLDGLDGAGMQFLVGQLETYTVPDLPDILPDAVQEALEGRQIPIGYNQEWMTPSRAIPAYKQFYQQIKEIWQYRDVLKSMLQKLLLLDRILSNAFVQKIRQAIELLSKSIQELVKEFRQTIKQKVREKMFQMIETLTGVDVPEEKRQQLEEWLHAVHEGVEGMTHSTSLESRMGPGGDLAGEQPGSARIPEGPLPPSHSEISKDHPDHPADEEHSVHGPEGASPFYEIHRQLAISADQHLGMLMETAWQSVDPSAQLIAGENRTFDPAQQATRDAAAGQAAERAEQLANEENRNFAQRDEQPDELVPVLNAVDLYISHPQDSEWWRSIIQNYIRDNPDQVYNDIQRRNAMRGARE